MKIFTLYRSKWYRGQGTDNSLLLAADGTMCCIGMLGEQCGIPLSAMLNKPAAEDVDKTAAWPFNPSSSANTDLMEAYYVNDDPSIRTDKERIAKLVPIFAEWGFKLEVAP